MLYDQAQKCYVCENELTNEELAFNNQIISYKQGKGVNDPGYEAQDNQDKISEVGRNIIESNLKKGNGEGNANADFNPIMCAKCMYDLYMSKGIAPQTKAPGDQKYRSHSATKADKVLTNEEMNRKIQKEMIIAKHLGNQAYRNDIPNKPNLISAAQTTFAGNNYKPTIYPKLNNLKSNFADLSGATDLIEQQNPALMRTLVEVSRMFKAG